MEKSEEKACLCSGGPRLVFACSGAADVGAVADLAARRLTRDGIGKMYCLAGLGGHVENIVATTQAAGKILAIDGCPVNCAKRTLAEAGFSDFAHLQLADIGLAKGASPATDDNVRIAVEAATPLLAQ